jgi:hypothetical protein
LNPDHTRQPRSRRSATVSGSAGAWAGSARATATRSPSRSGRDSRETMHRGCSRRCDRRGWRSSSGSPTTTPDGATAHSTTSHQPSSNSNSGEDVNSHCAAWTPCPHSGGRLRDARPLQLPRHHSGGRGPVAPARPGCGQRRRGERGLIHGEKHPLTCPGLLDGGSRQMRQVAVPWGRSSTSRLRQAIGVTSIARAGSPFHATGSPASRNVATTCRPTVTVV